MTNEIRKQYDRLDDVPSIILCIKEVYAVPNRHIRYAMRIKFFRTKMAQGSSVHSHAVKMLFLVENLEDLKARLDNDTYVDVILQSLPPSYDPFIINYNMNGLEKMIHELINILVQYEATTHKSVPAVLVGEASTSKAKCKSGGRWKRMKGKGKAVIATAGVIANCLLDLVRTDVCGPLNTPTRGGYSYFITFTDDHSRYGYVYLMRYKSEVFGRLKEYILEVENQTGHKIKILRSDLGGEYLSGEFIE
ncbi:UNVERIFIED_CONTAM: hypothetical protein Sradi_3183900 [Sesamum radiatum]|uniref:Integrase catalytic domain-containing protein n=1 Tax=Sesamum radiatum TaxID=300843 RepID=A0AAW2RFI3_SESRA